MIFSVSAGTFGYKVLLETFIMVFILHNMVLISIVTELIANAKQRFFFVGAATAEGTNDGVGLRVDFTTYLLFVIVAHLKMYVDSRKLHILYTNTETIIKYFIKENEKKKIIKKKLLSS